jgi:hypothetical protein
MPGVGQKREGEADMKESLLILILLLQVADIYTTLRVLSQGGREINGLVKWLMDRVGVLPALLASKAVVIAGLVLLYFGADWIFCPVVGGLAVVYAVVATNNYTYTDH